MSSEQEFLKYWLLFVAVLRVTAVGLGYLKPFVLQTRVFSKSPEQFTYLSARTFGIWTAVTCTLCVLCAFNVHERGIFLATLLSFVWAIAFFLVELGHFQTMSFRNILSPFMVAGTSIIWMSSYYVRHF